MPKFVTKFSGLLSASSVAIAVLVGVMIGAALTFAAIAVFWG